VNQANANEPKIRCHGIKQGLQLSRDLPDRLDQRVNRDRSDLRVSVAPLGLPAPRVRRDFPAPNRIGFIRIRIQALAEDGGRMSEDGRRKDKTRRRLVNHLECKSVLAFRIRRHAQKLNELAAISIHEDKTPR
jgi:hypothetical protein